MQSDPPRATTRGISWSIDMKTGTRLRAIMGLKRANYPDLLARAKAIHNGIAGHPAIFQSPNPPLVTLQTQIAALEQAQQDTATRAKGTVATRDLRGDELLSTLDLTCAYVQGLVDQSPEQGAAIIERAGMLIGDLPRHAKPELKASQATPGAPVELVANVRRLTAGVAGKVLFRWQSSGNGGATWNELDATPHGRTEVSGLTPLSTWSFRACVVGGKGAADWSQAVTFLVH